MDKVKLGSDQQLDNGLSFLFIFIIVFNKGLINGAVNEAPP